MSIWYEILVEYKPEAGLNCSLIDGAFLKAGGCIPDFHFETLNIGKQKESGHIVPEGTYFKGGGKNLKEKKFLKILAAVTDCKVHIYRSWEGVEDFVPLGYVEPGKVVTSRYLNE